MERELILETAKAVRFLLHITDISASGYHPHHAELWAFERELTHKIRTFEQQEADERRRWNGTLE